MVRTEPTDMATTRVEIPEWWSLDSQQWQALEHWPADHDPARAQFAWWVPEQEWLLLCLRWPDLIAASQADWDGTPYGLDD